MAVMVEPKNRFLMHEHSSSYCGDALRKNFNSSLFSLKA